MFGIFQVIIECTEYENIEERLWNMPSACEHTANILQ